MNRREIDEVRRRAVANAAAYRGGGAAEIDAAGGFEAALNAIERRRRDTIGQPVRVRGVDFVVLDAAFDRVVLEVDDDAADEAEITRRFPSGDLVRMGGYYFQVGSVTAARVVFRPHGKSKLGRFKKVRKT